MISPLDVTLRDVHPDDLDHFFELLQDIEAIAMAAFTPADPADRGAFDDHWRRILSNDSVTMLTILWRGAVAGNVGSFTLGDDRDVAYWIDRDYWGTGIATEALRQFLRIDTTRPIHATAVKDNLGSIRVLAKNGFEMVGSDEGYAHGRGEVVKEVVMHLTTPAS